MTVDSNRLIKISTLKQFKTRQDESNLEAYVSRESNKILGVNILKGTNVPLRFKSHVFDLVGSMSPQDGDSITVSFDAQSETGNCTLSLFAGDDAIQEEYIGSFNVTTAKQHFSGSVTYELARAEQITFVTHDGSYFVNISNLKMEFGNTATNWSPAPGDSMPDAGDSDTPIYYENGVPKPCGSTLDVSINGSASSAGSVEWSGVQNPPSTYTPSSHTHGNITNDGKIGTASGKPIITTTGGALTTGSFGSTTGTFCEGNDSRLSNARTPTSHTHGNITNAGAIGSTANLPIITGANGVLQAGSFGTTANSFCEGNDSRLSNARTPLAHTHDASDIVSGTIDIARLPHGALERLVKVADQAARFALTTATVQNGDSVQQLDTKVMYVVVDDSKLNSEDGYDEYVAGIAASVPWSGITDKPSTYTPSSHTHGNITNDGKIGTTSGKPIITTTGGALTTGSFGTSAGTFCQGNDSRLSDARTPVAHTHSGSDITSAVDVATKLGTSDVGSDSLPIYLDDGVPKPVTRIDPPYITSSSRPYYYIAMHNRVGSCKNLLADYTLAELSSMISAGTFDDIYVGDWFQLSLSVDGGGTQDKRVVVAGIDTHYGIGPTALTTHHITMVFEEPLNETYMMNNSSTNAGGYNSSYMARFTMPSIQTKLNTAMGSGHILSHYELVSSGVNSSTLVIGADGSLGAESSSVWTEMGVMPLSVMQLYGYNLESSVKPSNGIIHEQLPLFAQIPNLIRCNGGYASGSLNRYEYWLNDVLPSNSFAYVGSRGELAQAEANVAKRVRPYFLFY